jgi:hypothetical protein
MKNFLTAILRTQFNLFYRFGYTFVPDSLLIEFDGNIDDQIKVKMVDLFLQLQPFKYDEEYLIIHLEQRENVNSKNARFSISNLVAIYPLSARAKFSIESKIDTRIALKEPIFEPILDSIDAIIYRNEISQAISALWALAEFDEDVESYVESIGMENILSGIEFRKLGTKANKIRDANYWSYLIAYDRYDYFPNSTMGYFYDAGQIFAYSKGRDSFEGSDLYKFLHSINFQNPTYKFDEIVNRLESDPTIRNGYVAKTTVSNCKLYIIAPLFFKLKEEIRDKEDLQETVLFKRLNELKSTLGDHLKYAIVLLGAFFGFEKFYDAYYDKLNLRFYRSYKAPRIKLIESSNEIANAVLESDDKTMIAEDVLKFNDLPQIENETSKETDIQEIGLNEIDSKSFPSIVTNNPEDIRIDSANQHSIIVPSMDMQSISSTDDNGLGDIGEVSEDKFTTIIRSHINEGKGSAKL